MNRVNEMSGVLEMIIGCMYSGKSSLLINRKRQHVLLGKTCIVITHYTDKRYGKEIVSSHDNITMDAIPLANIKDILSDSRYNSAHSIFIEEAQFFPDLYETVKIMVDNDKKHVVLSGLDGDYERKPFKQIVDLIPFADNVERKNALCVMCKNGNIASFSKRLFESNERNVVGGFDQYVPVCRYHYLQN
jgi:thymidine kinase